MPERQHARGGYVGPTSLAVRHQPHSEGGEACVKVERRGTDHDPDAVDGECVTPGRREQCVEGARPDIPTVPAVVSRRETARHEGFDNFKATHCFIRLFNGTGVAVV